MSAHDTTIPGGRYIDSNGFWKNAEGQFIDADGNVVEEPVKANAPKVKPKADEPKP